MGTPVHCTEIFIPWECTGWGLLCLGPDLHSCFPPWPESPWELPPQTAACSAAETALHSCSQPDGMRIEHHTKVTHNTSPWTTQSVKGNEQVCLISYPSKRLRELGFLFLQQLPLNLPLVVSLSHYGQLSTLSRGSTLTKLPLLLSALQHNICNTRKIPPRGITKIARMILFVFMCRSAILGTA